MFVRCEWQEKSHALAQHIGAVRFGDVTLPVVFRDDEHRLLVVRESATDAHLRGALPDDLRKVIGGPELRICVVVVETLVVETIDNRTTW